MWAISKVFIEFVTILLLFLFGFLATRHLGSQLPNQGLNLHPPALESSQSSPQDHQGGPRKLFLITHFYKMSTVSITFCNGRVGGTFFPMAI